MSLIRIERWIGTTDHLQTSCRRHLAQPAIYLADRRMDDFNPDVVGQRPPRPSALNPRTTSVISELR
jgi:hypothetical protein